MRFVRRADGRPTRLGILPGTFNPVTVAHLALARAAQSCCDEIVFVLPRVFPHKTYAGASFGERLELLQAALAGEARLSLAVADAGLFIEIAGECRQAYGPQVRFSFLCGRDAAERIAGWDYGSAAGLASMFRHFDILVAARNGDYAPPEVFSDAFERLPMPQGFEHVSATQVRERLAQGTPWEHLVPASIRERVREIYSRSIAKS